MRVREGREGRREGEGESCCSPALSSRLIILLTASVEEGNVCSAHLLAQRSSKKREEKQESEGETRVRKTELEKRLRQKGERIKSRRVFFFSGVGVVVEERGERETTAGISQMEWNGFKMVRKATGGLTLLLHFENSAAA